MSREPSVWEQAARLIEEGWCQGRQALDQNGDPVVPTSNRAVRWCAAGAIIHQVGVRDATPLIVAVTAKLGSHLATWNDSPERTQAEVAALLRSMESPSASRGRP